MERSELILCARKLRGLKDVCCYILSAENPNNKVTGLVIRITTTANLMSTPCTVTPLPLQISNDQRIECDRVRLQSHYSQSGSCANVKCLL